MKCLALALLISAAGALPVTAADLAPKAAAEAAPKAPVAIERFEVPSTVSPEAKARLELIYRFLRAAPPQSKPTSIEEWDSRQAASDKFGISLSQPIVDALKVSLADDSLGGVPVVRFRPAGWKPTGQTLIFIHGGGYVTGSARGNASDAAQMAALTGNEVISVNYTLAPRGRWRAVTDEIVAVWQALLKSGAKPESIGIYGGSAGGGLAAGAVLKMRDKALPLPGALYLMSPWSDITATGDTITTLAAAEPLLTSESLAWGADLYADPADQKNPYVSPVYGDYSKAFPPTLIQVGTREMFVSHAVRHYQAIRGGGHEAVLDVYEGMPHGFPSLFTETPEGRTAFGRAADFFKTHLARGKAK